MIETVKLRRFQVAVSIRLVSVLNQVMIKDKIKPHKVAIPMILAPVSFIVFTA